MIYIYVFLSNLRSDKSGAVAIEYVIIASLIAGGLLLVIDAYMIGLTDAFKKLGASVGKQADF